MSIYSTKESVILDLHKIPTLIIKNDSIKDNIYNQKTDDIINIDLIPDKEEEDGDEDDKKMKKTFNNINNGLSSNVNTKNQKINFKSDTLSRKYRSKIIKGIKKKLDDESRNYNGKRKKFKINKSFTRMSHKNFYCNYIENNLSIKDIFIGFNMANAKIFKKIQRKSNNNEEFENFINTGIIEYFNECQNTKFPIFLENMEKDYGKEPKFQKIKNIMRESFIEYIKIHSK